MSKIIAIVGPSGSGKSTSFRNLNDEETFIINVSKKALPFKGWKGKYRDFAANKEEGNLYMQDSPAQIVKALRFIDVKRPDIQTIIIDDAQYIMANEFMNRSQEAGWQKFTDIAKHIWDVVDTARNLTRDIHVIFTFHDEDATDNTGKSKKKIKTIGKMVDDKVTLEGLFTIVFYTAVQIDKNTKIPEFLFQTKTDGSNTCKTPLDMFEEMFIPNDLQTIIETIKEYDS